MNKTERKFRESFAKEREKKRSKDYHNKNYPLKKPYLKWRKNSCEMCNFNEDKRVLQIHHLNPKLKGTEKDNPSNCITVCFNHHAMIEYGKYPSWKNRAEFEKWILNYKKKESFKKFSHVQ